MKVPRYANRVATRASYTLERGRVLRARRWRAGASESPATPVLRPLPTEAVNTPRIERTAFRAQDLEATGPTVVSLERGSLSVRSGEELLVRMEVGDLLTLPADGSATLTAPQGAAEGVMFRASTTWAREACRLAGRPLSAERPSPFLHRAGSDAARRGGRLLRELIAPGRDCGLERTARRLELLSLVATAGPGFVDPRPRENRRLRTRRSALLELLDRLRSEPLEGIGLATIAARLGTSERQTSRLFRAELSTTFREYMSELRLNRAKELLRNTDRSVIDVAAETGWRSLAHFTTTFGRRVGLTPSAYRVQARRDERAA